MAQAPKSAPAIYSAPGDLLFCAGFQVFLVFAGQFDESGREADIFVNGIAVVIARDHFGALFVGHGGGNLVQPRAEQVRQQEADTGSLDRLRVNPE